MITEVNDPLHARVGDRVRIEDKQPGRVKAGFLLLMLPLLAFIPGYFGGEAIAELTNTLTREAWGVLIGIVTFSIPWIILFLLNKNRKRKRSYRMHIVGVVNSREKKNGS
jgi:positive regulator of sigma E activity